MNKLLTSVATQAYIGYARLTADQQSITRESLNTAAVRNLPTVFQLALSDAVREKNPMIREYRLWQAANLLGEFAKARVAVKEFGLKETSVFRY